ncbi:hypothetical protein [Bacillus thuringiensis]|uniref:Uncharacterized protein n=1 Tax=Bacillus thuringiensis Bt18247 TaxID=1423143 RepID=A0A9W3XCA0_BACTU|nr:hypothetical protein [Bacillus thuringiensis]AOM14587.1 hypothetical protein BTI247_62570 [Bacillus thuringiensis Bt18247]MBG9523698.1 hypothetical protein [Bacillus thuringiensis]
MKNQPNWQPIQNLPIIANLIDGQSSDAKEQYINLLEARNKPQVLVQIKDTFQRAMGIPIGIVLYAINPNN